MCQYEKWQCLEFIVICLLIIQSKNLVTTGLDALETIGKKTFDAINERDPGLKKTRGFLADRGDKPNLSAVLREAKEQEEVRAQQEMESEEARKAHFGSLFDDFQGTSTIIHLYNNTSLRCTYIKQNYLITDLIYSYRSF